MRPLTRTLIRPPASPVSALDPKRICGGGVGGAEVPRMPSPLTSPPLPPTDRPPLPQPISVISIAAVRRGRAPYEGLCGQLVDNVDYNVFEDAGKLLYEAVLSPNVSQV